MNIRGTISEHPGYTHEEKRASRDKHFGIHRLPDGTVQDVHGPSAETQATYGLPETPDVGCPTLIGQLDDLREKVLGPDVDRTVIVSWRKDSVTVRQSFRTSKLSEVFDLLHAEGVYLINVETY